MIAFSTCWNSGRHTAGDETLREIKNLGFNRIELGHGIRISLMPGIQGSCDAHVADGEGDASSPFLRTQLWLLPSHHRGDGAASTACDEGVAATQRHTAN